MARTDVKTLGNFWVDLTRCSLYVLLPISIVVGLFFVSQGMPQNFHAYERSIARGVLAIHYRRSDGLAGSHQRARHQRRRIRQRELGRRLTKTRRPLTNFVEMLLIFVLGAGLTYTYGKMVKDTRQGWAIFTAMSMLFFVGFAVAYWAEAAGNPIVHQLGVAGGNMEGKECRFGAAASALFATVTTDTSCGAVNAMHDSFMPLGGLSRWSTCSSARSSSAASGAACTA